MNQKVKSNFIKLLEVADAAYPDGYIGMYYDIVTGKRKRADGDTLALFIGNELSDASSENLEDSIQKSIQMLRGAKREIDDVIEALLETYSAQKRGEP